MRAALVVAAREISERKRIFVAAAVAGLLPFLAPLFPDVARGDVPQVRAVFALVASAAFGIGTAIVLGASVLVRDVAERRAAFWFARPLSSFSIWSGKTLGALLLAAGAALLAVLPAWIAAPGGGLVAGSLSPATTTFGLAGLFFGGLVFLVALFHAAAVAVRSRSPWLVVDVILLAVCVTLVVRSAMRLYREGYFQALTRAVPWGVAALLVLLLAAGAAQVAAGRTELRRGHGAQSLTIWGVALPATLLGAGFTLWLVSPAPGDLVHVWTAHAAPSGDWLLVEGLAEHRGPATSTFLVSPKTGSFLRLPGGPRLSRVEFTPDGRSALWWELESGRQPLWRLWKADLSADQPESRALTIVAEGWPNLGISPSGRRIAVRAGRTLSVIELDSERTITAVRLETDAHLALFFENEETVRLFVSSIAPADRSAHEATLLEFRIPERRLERTGAVPRDTGDRLELWYAAGGERLLALDANRTRLTLRDGRTGGLRATISQGPRLSSFVPVAGGAVAALESTGGVLRLHRFAVDGASAGPIELGPLRGGFLCGPAADGRLLVAVRTGTENVDWWRQNWTLLGIDLTSGQITARETGLAPTEPWRWTVEPVLATAGGPGATPARYFLDRTGALVFYDAVRGTRTRILPKGP